MNLALFAHTWRANRTRVLLVAVALAIWSTFLPIIYDSFGSTFQDIFKSGAFPPQFAQFGGGDIFSLSGSVAIGFIHPITVGLNLVFAVGFTAAAIAGERQRGTLEVLLARPISRRRVYVTALAATFLFVAVVMAANLGGVVAGATLFDVADELRMDRLLVVWANAVLLFTTLGALALAASASFHRVVPALGIVLAFTIASYAVELLGALWPDIAGWRPWSFFHYFQPAEIMAGDASPGDAVVLAGITAAAVAFGLWIFPRRDLAAPS